MKITLDIKQNTINTILGHVAKHNGVDKKDVTNDMFMDEFAHTQRHELFQKVAEEFYTARTTYERKYADEQLQILLDEAIIQKGIKEIYPLQVEGMCNMFTVMPMVYDYESATQFLLMICLNI